jgi:SpoVK/Ycf46/Vps4 family AAA+-type ATPase
MNKRSNVAWRHAILRTPEALNLTATNQRFASIQRMRPLQVHARKHLLADDVNLEQLANDVPGLVGADLANLLNEAALDAIRDGSDAIYWRNVLVRSCSAWRVCMVLTAHEVRWCGSLASTPDRVPQALLIVVQTARAHSASAPPTKCAWLWKAASSAARAPTAGWPCAQWSWTQLPKHSDSDS